MRIKNEKSNQLVDIIKIFLFNFHLKINRCSILENFVIVVYLIIANVFKFHSIQFVDYLIIAVLFKFHSIQPSNIFPYSFGMIKNKYFLFLNYVLLCLLTTCSCGYPPVLRKVSFRNSGLYLALSRAVIHSEIIVLNLLNTVSELGIKLVLKGKHSSKLLKCLDFYFLINYCAVNHECTVSNWVIIIMKGNALDSVSKNLLYELEYG